jgi:hypothetical protein
VIRRVLQPIGIQRRRAFPPPRSRGRSRHLGRRSVPVALGRFAFRRRSRAPRQTFVRGAATTVEAPRIQLVLAQRVHVARGRTARFVTASPQTAAEVRSRDSSVLRERLERTVMRALRIERRVEREVRDPQPGAGTASRVPPIPVAAPATTRTLVFREESRPGPDTPAMRADSAPAPVDPPGEAPRPDVTAVADAVLRVLDRRIVAERERRGHV